MTSVNVAADEVAASEAVLPLRSSAKVLFAVFCVTFLVYAVSPVRQNYDSYLAFPTAQSIVHDADLLLDEFDAPSIVGHASYATTEDGQSTNYFPWVSSLALVPAVIALDIAGAVGVGDGSYAVANGGSMDVIQQLTGSLIVALVVTLMVVVVHDRLRPASRSRLAVSVATALVFAFGTAAWSTASRAVWQHGPSMLMLALSVLLLQRLRLDATRVGPRVAAVGLGAAVALSYTIRPTNAIVVIAVSIYVLAALRRSIAWYVLGGCLVGALWAIVNVATYGSLLPPYNTASRLSIHESYLEAVAANLFSPARGLLLFSPIVLFCALRWTKQVDRYVWPQLRQLDVMLLAISVVYLLAVSGLTENWWSGHSFGPRFMSDTLVVLWCLVAPLAMIVADAFTPRSEATPTRAMRATASAVVVAAAWGVVVNAEGGTMRSTLCWNGEPNIDENVDRIWSWSEPQIASGFSAVVDDGVTDAFLTRCTD